MVVEVVVAMVRVVVVVMAACTPSVEESKEIAKCR